MSSSVDRIIYTVIVILFYAKSTCLAISADHGIRAHFKAQFSIPSLPREQECGNMSAKCCKWIEMWTYAMPECLRGGRDVSLTQVPI